MAYTIPTDEPAEFIAGDTVTWYKSLSDYLPATWTLSYAFQLEGSSGQQETEDAADTGDGRHLVTITAAESVDYGAGIWHWQSYVTSGSDRYAVDYGRFTVLANFDAAATTVDARSHVKITLDAIQAVMQNRATKEQGSYSIAGRSLSLMTLGELAEAEVHYEAKYASELRLEARRRGTGGTGKILTRFV